MTKFACAQAEYGTADYVVLGVPFDRTSSLRAGTADGPEEVRRASYCFEPYMMEYGVSLFDMDIHDMGDISKHDQVEDMGEEIENLVTGLIRNNKFPIIIGGEHSLSPFVVAALEDIYVVILDAHLDYRDEYEGMKRSHATSTKRISELSIKGLNVMGVRSISQEESIIEKPSYVTSYEMFNRDDFMETILEDIGDKKVYLSIDMDVFDPSYAPGVGNPEPYGITPLQCKGIIDKLSGNLIGADIVETCPKYDHDKITSNLAARLIYDILGSRLSKANS